MAEFAALPLFTDAYMRDCWHLSDAEHGRYLLLLILTWQTPGCRIPNDEEWIARRLRRTVEEYRLEIKPLVDEFFVTSGNWITQKRLLKEFAYVQKHIKKQSDAAKSRWNKEKDPCHGIAKPNAKLMPPHQSRHASGIPSGNAPSPSPSPSPSSHHPQSGPVPSESFEEVDAMLRKIPSLEKHPVAVDPVIHPVWQLVQQGYDLRRQIIPSITRQVANLRAGKSIKNWKYFVPGIIDDAQTIAPPGAVPANGSSLVDDAKWENLLAIGRRDSQWDIRNYGPIPATPGCRVPAHLLKPGDGQDWTEWKPDP